MAPSASGAAAVSRESLPQTIEFNRHIRPILSDNCFECHGPDENARKADLRFDLQETALADRQGNPAIVPGHPESSELVRRITHSDTDERMPPPEAEKVLTRREIALLKQWIEEGAPWQGHWAFIPPTRPEPPILNHSHWPKNEIDAFILARLEKEGLQPSPPAKRRILLRRLYFDLTGLPPSPAEVEAFVQNPDPNAYEQAVDRLLASPEYGERMAVHWLDLVRYADSVGYHGDQPMSVHFYREYVIDAFNANTPFDQFTVEQLAGDLLPEATTEQKIASGYNRLNMITAEGGAQAKEYLAKYAADRVRTTSSVWMGSTLGCAECHDHKFDPFTSKDFYSFAAFFADLKEQGVYSGGQAPRWDPYLPLPSPKQEERMTELKRRIGELRKKLETPTPELLEARQAWEDKVRKRLELPPPELDPWQAVGPFPADDFDQAYDKAFGPEEDQSPEREYKNNGERLKWEPHPEWEDGQTHSLTGDHSATYLLRTIHSPVERPVTLSLGSDDSLRVWLNGEAVFEKKIQRGVEPDQDKVQVDLQPGENSLLMKIVNGTGGYGFYFKLLAVEVPEEIAEIVRVTPEDRTEEQLDQLTEHYLGIAPALEPVREELESLTEEQDKLEEAIPVTLVSKSVEPRTMRVLPRGNWMDDSGEVVKPSVPGFLPQPPETRRRLTRLDLAEWLVSEKNPLAGRAFVNRLWALYFGTGLSKQLQDLGSQGEWPSHPRLLDWLSVEFMESGWDIQHMVKLMVMSNTYRQSSLPRSDLRQVDPQNRLLARQSRFRLDAEMVRDNALKISGLLNRELGGPSAKPYQPAGYYAQLNFPKREYQADQGEDLYRRTVYTHWQRTFLHPSLLAFDAPSREECTAQRERSNTPLQALVLLNDPIYVEAARVFAQRLLQEGGDSISDRLDFAYRQALGRSVHPEESELLARLYRDHLEDYRADPESARQLIQTGEFPLPDDLPEAELAAWTSVCRVVLNLHETITRY